MMSLESSQVTFGVEIEFNLAYLEIGNTTPHRASEETPRLLFPPVEEDMKGYSQQYISENSKSFQGRAGMWNILELLRTAGHPTDKAIRAEGGPRVWKVTDDSSIRPREGSGYEWQSVEVKSPALEFSSASLQLVSGVCQLITKTYVVDVPPSAGLHVHVSAGAGPFNFQTMKALFIFLWTFEYQLLSLHPPERQQNEYCRNFRQASRLSRGFYFLHKRPPTIGEGIDLLLSCDDITSLLDLARAAGDSKCMAYNPVNVLEFENRTCLLPTIEFRQHEGTVDGERITNWISTIVGLVSRLEQITPGELLELVLSQVEREYWQAAHDSTVKSSSLHKLKSIPAQSTFTAIDLLEWMGLEDQAVYYRGRIFQVVSTQPISPANETTGGRDECHIGGENLVESMKKRIDDEKQGLREKWDSAFDHTKKIG